MAYETSNPPALASQRVGADGGAIWIYKDGDALATVLRSGYIEDANDLGMVAGDKVIHIDSGNVVINDLAVVDHTSGTALNATTDTAGYSVGDSVITLASAGTGTVILDDVIQFAGDDTKYTITEGDTDVSDGGAITISPVLVVAIAAAATAITQVSNVKKLRASAMAGTIVLDEATTLTEDQSGGTFILSNATGFATTLPAPVAGLKYKFINGVLITSGNHTIVASGAIVQGNAMVASAVVIAIAETTITLVGTADSLGDVIELESDGTYWYVTAAITTTAGLTFA